MSVFTNPSGASAEEVSTYVSSVIELLGSKDPKEVLQSTVLNLRQSIEGLTKDQLTQAESTGKWSIRHVLQHLADSELVWGYRLRMVLAHDRPQLTGYDQDLWAERLHYNESEVEQALTDFKVLRNANLRIFSKLTMQELERAGIHAERGEESLIHMSKLYAGHDLLHLRQIDRIRRAIISL